MACAHIRGSDAAGVTPRFRSSIDAAARAAFTAMVSGFSFNSKMAAGFSLIARSVFCAESMTRSTVTRRSDELSSSSRMDTSRADAAMAWLSGVINLASRRESSSSDGPRRERSARSGRNRCRGGSRSMRGSRECSLPLGTRLAVLQHVEKERVGMAEYAAGAAAVQRGSGHVGNRVVTAPP